MCLVCAPQIAHRYKEKAKKNVKEQKKENNGKRKAPHSSIPRPVRRAHSLQPAASMPTVVPCILVADVNSLVYVPVVVGSEGDTEGLVSVEALDPLAL